MRPLPPADGHEFGAGILNFHIVVETSGHLSPAQKKDIARVAAGFEGLTWLDPGTPTGVSPDLLLTFISHLEKSGAAPGRSHWRCRGHSSAQLWARATKPLPVIDATSRKSPFPWLELHLAQADSEASLTLEILTRLMDNARLMALRGRSLEALARRRPRPLGAARHLPRLRWSSEASLLTSERAALAASLARLPPATGTSLAEKLWSRTLSELFLSRFWTTMPQLCELESQTFLAPESRETLAGLRRELEILRLQLEPLTGTLSEASWRELVGVAVAQREWMLDTGMVRHSSHRWRTLLQESPASTLAGS